MIGGSDLLDSAIYLSDECGFSVIPVRLDGSKAPGTETWREYQERRPTSEELRSWYGSGRVAGFGILQGRIAGRDEAEAGIVIDIDVDLLIEPFKAAVQSVAPGLIEKAAWVKSPNGYHFYCRYEVGDGPTIPNVKLAMGIVDGKPKALIETRGEGGYVVGPYSPAECHPSGRQYKCQPGGATLLDMQRLTREQINLLLDIARTFDEMPTEEPAKQQAPASGDGARPGDDYNARANWHEILEPHGWKCVGQSAGKELWKRPGKDAPGISATTGCTSKAGNDLLVVFSSNAYPFDSCGPGGRAGASYTRFAAYALLNHAGDFQAATRALGDAGYGSDRKPERPKEEQEQSKASPASKPVGVLLRDVARSWTSEADRSNAPARFPVGLPWEWGPSQMLLLGGGPGGGKTTLALQAIQDALLNDRSLRAVIANCEMRPEDLFTRQLALHSGVSYSHLRYRDDLTQAERKRVETAYDELVTILGDRVAYVSGNALEPVEEAARQHGANVVMCDYVQRYRTAERTSDKRVEVNRVMERLREMCFRGPGVLAISALSRGGKDSGYDKPTITSFRESGELEYACDEGYALSRQDSVVELHPVKLRFRSLEEGRMKLQQDHSLRFAPLADPEIFEGWSSEDRE